MTWCSSYSTILRYLTIQKFENSESGTHRNHYICERVSLSIFETELMTCLPVIFSLGWEKITNSWESQRKNGKEQTQPELHPFNECDGRHSVWLQSLLLSEYHTQSRLLNMDFKLMISDIDRLCPLLKTCILHFDSLPLMNFPPSALWHESYRYTVHSVDVSSESFLVR